MSIVKATRKSTVDITSMTDTEQKEIDAKILQDWGNPRQDKFIELKNGFTEKNFLTSGDVWYYLTEDIDVKFSNRLDILKGHIRILLNGYSISGDIQIRAANSSSTLSIFDKIPNKEGKEYNYNPNAIKYYRYNTALKAYTEYSTTQPSGKDVTTMPTWKENTYIKVVGSAFASNAINTDVGIYYISTMSGTLNMHGINLVGRKGHKLILYINGQNTKGTLNLNQCNLIANIANNGYSAICLTAMSNANLKGCKIYGNQDSGLYSYAGIQPSDRELPGKASDISLQGGRNQSGTLIMNKSNIGAIASVYYNAEGKSTSYGRAVYVKDVDFGQEVTIKDGTVSTFFENVNDIRGTIELVFKNTTNYNGNSPDLNFIVHGGDIDAEQKRGYNALTVGEAGVLGNITTVFEPVSKDITINGRVAEISTAGNVIVGSTGHVAIQSEQKISGTLKNDGHFTIQSGRIVLNNFINYGHFTIQSGKILGGTCVNHGHITIQSKKNMFSTITNHGQFTIEMGQILVGTITNNSTLIIKAKQNSTEDGTNNGGAFIVEANIKIPIKSGQYISGNLINEGKIIIYGGVKF